MMNPAASVMEIRHEPPGCTGRRTGRCTGRVVNLGAFSLVRYLARTLNDRDIPPLAGGVIMTARPDQHRPLRVRQAHVEWVAERLTDRDRAILDTVHRLRLITGSQIERLHFVDLSLSVRSRVRRRVLARLVAWRVLLSLERRIGGVRAGSSGLVFALDSAGQQLTRLEANLHGQAAVRRPREPSTALLSHTLSVAELYVTLVERSRLEPFTVAAFTTEPACWHGDGRGVSLKPDAYLKLSTDALSDHWWLEADKGTEHLPTIRHKLMTYLDFANGGSLGPGGVLPRVLVTVPSEARATAVAGLIARLPEPAERLLYVITEAYAPEWLLTILRE
jgi:hypothetical protein